MNHSVRRLQQLVRHTSLLGTGPGPFAVHRCLCRGAAGDAAVARHAQPQVTLYTARSSFPAFNGWKITILLEELKASGALAEFAVRPLITILLRLVAGARESHGAA